MNRGRGPSIANSSGFTIVESLLFLAVSAALFVSAMLLISGRQGKAQFENAVRNFESQLIDIANDVANGYYQNTGNITCNDNGAEPVITSASKNQGTNEDCIFIGRVIVPTDATRERVNVYSLAGLRKTSGTVLANEETKDVKTLTDARPRLVNVPGTVSTQDIGHGTNIECIKIDTGAGLGGCVDAAIGFLTDLRGGIAAANSSQSGAGVQAILYAYQGLAPDYNTTSLGSSVNTANYTTTLVKSATICLKSGTTNQSALIKIGTEGSSSLTITSEIKQGNAC